MNILGSLVFLASCVIAFGVMLGREKPDAGMRRIVAVFVLAIFAPITLRFLLTQVRCFTASLPSLHPLDADARFLFYALLSLFALIVLVAGYVAFVNRHRRLKAWRGQQKTARKVRVDHDD